MKRNFIVITVATAMMAPTVVSAGDIKVYGAAQIELASVNAGNDPDQSLQNIDNARGRLGFAATEDIGGSTKVVAKFEFQLDTSDNNSEGETGKTGTNNSGKASLTARESMIGFKGNWGTFEAGTLKSAYKYTGGVKYDPFVTTTLESRGNGGMSAPNKDLATQNLEDFGHQAFHRNAIGYRGKFGMFRLFMTLGLETNIGTDANGVSVDDGSATLSGMLKQKNWEVFLAFADAGGQPTVSTASNPTDPDAEYSALKLGGKFKFGNHTVVGQYEMLTDDPTGEGGAGTAPTLLHLGYQMKFGKNMFVVQVGLTDSDGAEVTDSNGIGQSRDVSMYTMGIIHKFSKTTRTFAGYRYSSSDSKEQEKVLTVGIRKDF